MRREYGARYRIMAASSGEAALESLRELKLRNASVALFLVDQRMPRMTGVEFLETALPMFPEAKRALLTAYADTDAAIRAINSVQIDHYLMKPWDPPEENLYGVLNDLLDDWQTGHRAPFDGIRVLGHRWSAQSNEVRDFLARHFVPYEWLDLERNAEARQLLETGGIDPTCIPVVLFPDGTRLVKPTTADLALQLHLNVRAESPFYDLVVVGGGPAGLAATVYGAADGLKTLLVERNAPGGQAGLSSRIENYLGFPSGLSGGDLARRAVAQARRFGAEILAPQHATRVRVEGPSRVVTLSDGSEITCRALLISTGIAYRKLELPGADRLNGSGIYYYPQMTEAMSHPDADLHIVGGANSAAQAAVFFSKHARSVTMLVRGASLSAGMSQYLEDRIKSTQNIKLRLETVVTAVAGAERCEMLTLRNLRTGQEENVASSALFIYAGAVPYTDWLENLVQRDAQGYVIAGGHLLADGKKPRGWSLERDPYFLETSVPGIFVAGDVRHRSQKGVSSGVGEGAMAVKMIHEYLSQT